jgi:hypothetical protein
MEKQFTDEQTKQMMFGLFASEGDKVKNIASKYTIRKTTLKPSIEAIFTQRRVLVGGAARLSIIELELIHLIDELFKKCLAYGIQHIQNGKTATEKQHAANFINGLIEEMQNDNRKLLVFATQKGSEKEIIEMINLMIKTIETRS